MDGDDMAAGEEQHNVKDPQSGKRNSMNPTEPRSIFK